MTENSLKKGSLQGKTQSDFASAHQPEALEYCKNLLKDDNKKERKKTI